MIYNCLYVISTWLSQVVSCPAGSMKSLLIPGKSVLYCHPYCRPQVSTWGIHKLCQLFVGATFIFTLWIYEYTTVSQDIVFLNYSYIFTWFVNLNLFLNFFIFKNSTNLWKRLNNHLLLCLGEWRTDSCVDRSCWGSDWFLLHCHHYQDQRQQTRNRRLKTKKKIIEFNPSKVIQAYCSN